VRKLPLDPENVPQIERVPYRAADLTGVDANLERALQQARGFVAPTQDVRGLGQKLQIFDRQGRDAVNRPERVARIHSLLPAVVIPLFLAITQVTSMGSAILPVIWAWAIAGRRVSRELTTVTRPSAGNLSTTLT